MPHLDRILGIHRGRDVVEIHNDPFCRVSDGDGDRDFSGRVGGAGVRRNGTSPGEPEKKEKTEGEEVWFHRKIEI